MPASRRFTFEARGELIVFPAVTTPNNPPQWDTQPGSVVQFVQGVAASFDMNDYASDPDMNPITFTMNDSEVSLPPGVTWTAGTGVLAYDGVGALDSTSGHIITVSDGVDSMASQPFDIAGGGVVGIVPNEPIIFSAAKIAADQAGLEIIVPSCNLGMANVRLRRNKDGGSFAEVGLFAVSAGTYLNLSLSNVGSFSPAPSGTPPAANAANWEITAAGLGLRDAADEFAFYHASHTGDMTAMCRIPNFAAPAGSKTMAQIMVRESTAAGARFYSAGRLNNDQVPTGSTAPIHSEAKWRLETDDPLFFLNPHHDLTGDVYIIVDRTGNLFSAWVYEPLLPPRVINMVSIPGMPATAEWGIAVCSGLAGTESTIPFESVGFNDVPNLIIADTVPSQTGVYEYEARGESA